SQMQGGSFCRIVALSDTDVFAILNESRARSSAPIAPGTPTPLPLTAVVFSYVVRLDGFNFVPTPGGGLPGEVMFAMEAVLAPGTRVPRGLFVATDDRVYITRDDG